MTTATIREKLHHYIDTADDEKVEAIYNLTKEELVAKNVIILRHDKLDLMKQASSDLLFLADLREIEEDFRFLDNESI